MMRGGKVRRQEKELTHPPPRFPKGAPKGRREDKGFFILGGERRVGGPARRRRRRSWQEMPPPKTLPLMYISHGKRKYCTVGVEEAVA